MDGGAPGARRRRIRLLATVGAACGATALCGVVAAMASASANGVTWRDKVDQTVLEAAAGGRTEFLVDLKARADLSPADALMNKTAKGRFVYERLTKVARKSQAPLITELERRGVAYRSFWITNAIWVQGGDLNLVAALAARNDVARVYRIGRGRLDPPVDMPDEPGPNAVLAVGNNISHVKANQAWALGYRGQGVVVGGADTGVRWTHSALKRQYRGWDGSSANHSYNWHDAIHVQNPGNQCPASGTQPCDDDTLLGGGHGTHTVGTIVGDDGAANQIGMAPDAKWIACRNMNHGLGVVPTYLECMEWFIAPTDINNQNPDPSKAPDVTNNSWGCVEGCPPPALQDVLYASRAAGIVYAVSAGNDGGEDPDDLGPLPPVYTCSSIYHPLARYPEAFTVGATYTHESDTIAPFSSRGPTPAGDTDRPVLRKPDITAPGVNVRSALRATDNSYGNLSGTSMAGPHVAGMVALVISANPSLRGHVDRIEEIIEQSARKLTTTNMCGGDSTTQIPNNTFGWGRIDALEAVRLAASTQVRRFAADFDGSGKDDIAVWRPEHGTWFIQGNWAGVNWGLQGDVPVPGDYDADPEDDITAWRPLTGRWHVYGDWGGVQWGDLTDVPVPADYDGDGKDEFAVYRPLNGTWYVYGNWGGLAWGQLGDIPVPGNYDADPAAEIAVWRPSTGVWHVFGAPTTVLGELGDIPVQADYNGDGTDEAAVYRPSNGTWYTDGGSSVQWGVEGDVPIAGDYDGDANVDRMIYRPINGTWYIEGNFAGTQWGQLDDIP